MRSLRHVISYDALPHAAVPAHATHPHGGKAAYKVSTYKRLGRYPKPSSLRAALTMSQLRYLPPF